MSAREKEAFCRKSWLGKLDFGPSKDPDTCRKDHWRCSAGAGSAVVTLPRSIHASSVIERLKSYGEEHEDAAADKVGSAIVVRGGAPCNVCVRIIISYTHSRRSERARAVIQGFKP